MTRKGYTMVTMGKTESQHRRKKGQQEMTTTRETRLQTAKTEIISLGKKNETEKNEDKASFHTNSSLSSSSSSASSPLRLGAREGGRVEALEVALEVALECLLLDLCC